MSEQRGFEALLNAGGSDSAAAGDGAFGSAAGASVAGGPYTVSGDGSSGTNGDVVSTSGPYDGGPTGFQGDGPMVSVPQVDGPLGAMPHVDGAGLDGFGVHVMRPTAGPDSVDSVDPQGAGPDTFVLGPHGQIGDPGGPTTEFGGPFAGPDGQVYQNLTGPGQPFGSGDPTSTGDPVGTDPVYSVPDTTIPNGSDLSGGPFGNDPSGGPYGVDPIVTDPTVSDPNVMDPIVTDPNVTDPIVTDPNVTDPIVTDPNVTDPNVTDPIVTDPNVTDPNVTDPIVTDPIATDPNVTDPNVTDPNATDPNIPVPSIPSVTDPSVTNPSGDPSGVSLPQVPSGGAGGGGSQIPNIPSSGTGSPTIPGIPNTGNNGGSTNTGAANTKDPSKTRKVKHDAVKNLGTNIYRDVGGRAETVKKQPENNHIGWLDCGPVGMPISGKHGEVCAGSARYIEAVRGQMEVWKDDLVLSGKRWELTNQDIAAHAEALKKEMK
ncbi:hypothetical protein [Sphaerisporangium perillae]|uniref:hypothetical protein n=1 Tax=Sphaerisporangium perillae TaxID=2935860 RepID=UPI00200F801D|nr:hypothetical protein [Sphaerisporangium perillae]